MAKNVPPKGSGYQEPTVIKFVSVNGGDQVVVEEFFVSDLFDPRVKQAALRFGSQGFALFDANFRSVAPSQCLEHALRDDSKSIFMIPRDQLRGRKRPADKGLRGRPRKFWRV